MHCLLDLRYYPQPNNSTSQKKGFWIVRTCYGCGSEIRECMGFVAARDFLKSQIPHRLSVRELCGICGVKALENPLPFFAILDAQDAQSREIATSS
jgi:hypothetical protein